MNNRIKNVLEQMGLSEKEILIYLAALETGGDSALALARKTGLQRVNTYYILEQLEKKGVVAESGRKGYRIFVATNPRKLVKLFQSKIFELESILPELLSVENKISGKPKIRFYDGVNGIKKVYEETLELNRGEEILSIATATLMTKYLDNWIKDYIKRRAKKGITIRTIAEDSAEARDISERDKAELRKSKLVDKEKFPFANEINIFGNKVMIASFKDLMGIIIESAEVAKTMRAFFELAWLGAREI